MIARVARVEGDVVVSFRQTPEGGTADVEPVSGPPMLQGVAVASVKAWHFTKTVETVDQTRKVTFHFQLDPPDDGYDSAGQPMTKVEVDGPGRVRVFSILTTGLERSECPSAIDSVVPKAVTGRDYVEMQRWNEDVRVAVDGSVTWKQGEYSKQGHITPAQAMALLERFRTQAVWRLCGDYSQAGLMDGDGSWLKLRIGGRNKNIREYGDVAPPVFREVELAVDAAANTHQWRHGDPKLESIIEITFEHLPKPGKTKLMDAVQRGDKAGIEAAFAAGDKLTDVDASGWTTLMYAASSFYGSEMSEMLKAGAEVNAKSLRGETALMASTVTSTVDEDLLRAGADVNAKNDVGMTALMLLAQRGEPRAIQTLLKAGADALKKDAAGRTALDYLNAASCGSPIIKEKDPQWMTVGYSTCNALGREEYEESKELLIDAGATATRVYEPEGIPALEKD